MFTTIWLETKDGHVVRKADIPKFIKGQEPEVILWGDRCFYQQPMMEVYREVTSYTLIDRPQPETECSLCLGSGYVDIDICPECNGNQVV